MATYDPQKGHARPKPTADEPAPVDELLDVAGESTSDREPAVADTAEPESAPEVESVVTPDAAPSAPSPLSVADASPAPAQVGGSARRLPAKKVGAGVALTALVFALSWAFRRRRRARRS